MPRRSSGGRSSGGFGGSSSWFSSRPTASAPSRKNSAPAPAPVASQPPPAPMQAGSASGGIGAAIVDGMAFGGGSAVAHRAVDAVLGPRTIRHEAMAAPAPASASAAAPLATSNSLGGSDACGFHLKAFQDCLDSSGSDISKCQFYMDMLSECRKNSGATVTA